MTSLIDYIQISNQTNWNPTPYAVTCLFCKHTIRMRCIQQHTCAWAIIKLKGEVPHLWHHRQSQCPLLPYRRFHWWFWTSPGQLCPTEKKGKVLYMMMIKLHKHTQTHINAPHACTHVHACARTHTHTHTHTHVMCTHEQTADSTHND